MIHFSLLSHTHTCGLLYFICANMARKLKHAARFETLIDRVTPPKLEHVSTGWGKQYLNRRYKRRFTEHALLHTRWIAPSHCCIIDRLVA